MNYSKHLNTLRTVILGATMVSVVPGCGRSSNDTNTLKAGHIKTAKELRVLAGFEHTKAWQIDQAARNGEHLTLEELLATTVQVDSREAKWCSYEITENVATKKATLTRLSPTAWSLAAASSNETWETVLPKLGITAGFGGGAVACLAGILSGGVPGIGPGIAFGLCGGGALLGLGSTAAGIKIESEFKKAEEAWKVVAIESRRVDLTNDQYDAAKEHVSIGNNENDACPKLSAVFSRNTIRD